MQVKTNSPESSIDALNSNCEFVTILWILADSKKMSNLKAKIISKRSVIINSKQELMILMHHYLEWKKTKTQNTQSLERKKHHSPKQRGLPTH